MSSTQAAVPTGRLAGKVALITGGTSGIGRAAAELFYAHGARVIITGQSESSLARARDELPHDLTVLRCDVRSVDECAALSTQVATRFGGLDVLFLNAGIARLGAFEQIEEAQYDEQMDTNVKGVVFSLQKLLPLLRSGASVIVNTSVASLIGAPHMALYAATKGALSALVRSLAVELAPRSFRVNALAPAAISTPIQEKFGLPPELRESMARAFAEKIPLGRFGEAREVANLALFLASDEASFVTGTELPVDGGLVVA